MDSLDDLDDFCDGGCGNQLFPVKNMIEVEDGVCFLCQRCYRVFKNQLVSDETMDLYISGRLVRKRKRENGKGILKTRQQASAR